MSTTSRIFAFLMIAAAAFAAWAEPPKEPPPEGFTLKGDPASGSAIYVANCASCHGKTGLGNGVAGVALKPPPASFADVKRFGGVSDWELYVAVRDGGGAVHLSPAMPAWGKTLTDAQVQNVVAYVKAAFLEPARKRSPASHDGGGR